MESPQIADQNYPGMLFLARKTGDQPMPDEPPASVDRELAAKIIAAYVRRNQVSLDQIGTLISAVHQALAGLGQPAEAVPVAHPGSDD